MMMKCIAIIEGAPHRTEFFEYIDEYGDDLKGGIYAFKVFKDVWISITRECVVSNHDERLKLRRDRDEAIKKFNL